MALYKCSFIIIIIIVIIINKKSYPIQLPIIIDNRVAITASVIHDILYMLHINRNFPNVCIFNDTDLYCMLNTLCTE